MAVSDERSLLPAGFLNPSVIFGTVSEYTIASRPGGRCGRLNIGRGSPPPLSRGAGLHGQRGDEHLGILVFAGRRIK